MRVGNSDGLWRAAWHWLIHGIAKEAPPRVNERMDVEVQEELLSQNQREIIRDALVAAGALQACGRCTNDSFELQPGITMVALQKASKDIILGGKQIPAAVVVCARCGAISTHALGALQLLNHPAFRLAD